MNNEKGSTQVITLLAMVVILGITALVMDVGVVFVQRVKLSNAADAAVLAGAMELPGDTQKAIEVANEYLTKNGIDTNISQIIISNNNFSIEVKINKNVDFYFAKAIGINDKDVLVSSKANIGPVSAVYDGIRPLVVEQQALSYGQVVTLKEGAGDGYHGNYGAVALGGSGANNFESNIKYGHKGKLKVGDIVYTETGNMSGSTTRGISFITDNNFETYNNFSKDSIRLWTIPIVETLEVDGNKPVKIVGFAEFFIESSDKKNGQVEITGRFLEFVQNGDIDYNMTDYGLRGVKLIN